MRDETERETDRKDKLIIEINLKERYRFYIHKCE